MNCVSCAQKGLVLALVAALMAPGAALAVQTSPRLSAARASSRKTSKRSNSSKQNRQTKAETEAEAKKTTKLKGMTVLGSLIPQVQVSNSVPVSVYTPEEIHAQGFSSFSEFMRHIPQASIVAAPDSSSAARASRPFEMHDLGPSRTLLLIDGQRGIDYPQPSSLNTSQDLSIIPPGLVEQVEITPSGLSSLYGSDAMNGVANVVLKQRVEGDHLEVTGGLDTAGGEHYRDYQFFGGRSSDKWNVMYSVEHKASSALYVRQRDKFNDLANAGRGTYGPADRMFGYQYGNHGGTAIQLSRQVMNGTNPDGSPAFADRFIAPPSGVCGAFGYLDQAQHSVETHGNKVGAVTNLGRQCVRPDADGDLALQPSIKSNYVFSRGSYNFTPDLQGFAQVTLFQSRVKSSSGTPELDSGGLPTPFYDPTSGQVISDFTRQISTDETGHNPLSVRDDERYFNLRFGLNGAFGDFNWDASLSRQKYFVTAHYRAFNAINAFHYFFGQQQGTKTIDGTVYPVYSMNADRFWKPISPSDYDSFAPLGEDSSRSLLDTAVFDLNNPELFDIPWDSKSVGWAVRLEASHQGLATSPDPRQLQPTLQQQLQFESPFGGVFGAATRVHYAVASQIKLPLTNWFTLGGSGRIDKYNGPSAADIARTWSGSFQIRPYSGLLLRGSYNTTFRAPGLGEVSFHDNPSVGTKYADPYECIINHEDPCVSTEHQQPIEERLQGNPGLKPEKGYTISYGLVWQVPGVRNMSFSADYWREYVKDGIDVFGSGTVLTLDAACLTGLEVGGQPFRGSAGTEIVSGKGSPICPSIEAAVPRTPDGQLLGVNAIPINVGRFKIWGIDYLWQWDVNMERFGQLHMRAQFNDLPYEAGAGGPDEPLHNVAFGRSVGRLMWSAAWSRGKWSASLGGVRYTGIQASHYDGCNILSNGIIPSVGDPECTIYKGRTRPWITWSGSVGYQFTKKLKARFSVHNIFNNQGELQFYSGSLGIPTNQGEYYTGRQVRLTLSYQID